MTSIRKLVALTVLASAVLALIPARLAAAGRGGVRAAGRAPSGGTSGALRVAPNTASNMTTMSSGSSVRVAPATVYGGTARPATVYAAPSGAGTAGRTGAGTYAGSGQRSGATYAGSGTQRYGRQTTAAGQGARGTYGTGAAVATAAAGRGTAVAGRTYGGPVWATQLPAGARSIDYRGRPYYQYGGYYYRPYAYAGAMYYGYVWPPYYTYYEDPPPGALTVTDMSEPMLYADGTYYEETYAEGGTRYQVVPAPEGATLPSGTLPPDRATVTVGGTTYELYGNTFYLERDGRLRVVSAPNGLEFLAELPADFEPLPVGALTYFRVGDRHYLSYLDPGGQELFLRVDPPGSGASGTADGVGTAASSGPPMVVLTVEAGTLASVHLLAGIDSATARPGDTFQAALDRELLSEAGRLVAAPGSRVYGKVVENGTPRGSDRPVLGIELTDVAIGGRMVPVRTNPKRYAVPETAPPDLANGLGAAVEGAPATPRLAIPQGVPIEFKLTGHLLVSVAG